MYDHHAIEKKWQEKWQQSDAFHVDLETAKRPFFTHVMFPYPSGDRLHMGHVYNFSIAHSYARFKRLQGYDVYEPMGFDSFGLPAENYAIKTGIHPAQSTQSNIETMIEQLTAMGNVYDWGSKVATHDPSYYRWTQWVFLQMYKNDLIYKKDAEVNWDPIDQTVLANEQVLPDGTAERSGAIVEKRKMPQWFARVTKYADELLEEEDELDWPHKTKVMQRNWIGKSQGAQIDFKVVDHDITLPVYSTRIDTIFSGTFLILAPEHDLVDALTTDEHKKDVEDYRKQVSHMNAIQRTDINNEKTGVFLGSYAINPASGDKMPIWISDFVLAEYGTGIVFADAHDKRDFDLAKKYNIPLKISLLPTDSKLAEKVKNLEVCFEDEGVLINSLQFDGMNSGEAKPKIIEWLASEKGAAQEQVNFRLRDWCISRQRYWGAPIPIVYDPEGKPHPIPEEYLPWTLPTDVEFKPTGVSPLAQSQELKERTEKIFGKGWTPEIDTMDTFVCSSFYTYRFLAYGDTQNFVDKDREKKWMPVDFYCGGSEHACMHLIYARFVTKALADMGHVSTREPYKRLFHQGMITRNGAKISKRSNPLSPDEWIEKYGSDVLRMYLMFMGPFDQGGDWNDRGISGTQRFAKRAYALIEEKYDANFSGDDIETLTVLHKSIKKIGDDIENLQFNTALSSLMETLNAMYKQEKVSRELVSSFVILLSPLAPHLAEELWEKIGGQGLVAGASWPEYNPMYLQESSVTIAVQVNGKLRGTYEFANGVTKEEVIETVYDEPNVARWLEGKSIVKEIFIPGKILNIVVK